MNDLRTRMPLEVLDLLLTFPPLAGGVYFFIKIPAFIKYKPVRLIGELKCVELADATKMKNTATDVAN